jgi:dihydrofolate synthase / folylpolyglutamate synthase
VIAAALADLEERVSRPLVLVVGMLASKDSAGFLRNFAGLARRVVGVPIRQPSTQPAEAIAAAAQAVGIPAETSGSIEEALRAIGGFNLEQPPRILATGSLYFAGEVLAANGTIPE